MAGPAASVLLPSSVTDAHAEIRRAREACGPTTGDDQDFWVHERPFIGMVGPEYPEELTEIRHGLSNVLGWKPEQVVTFAAMCNDDRDHWLLARLCIALSEAVGGIVDFGGCLPFGPNLDGTERVEPVRVVNPNGLGGVLFAATYETVPGLHVTTHYGDASFLRAWSVHPDFRMVK